LPWAFRDKSAGRRRLEGDGWVNWSGLATLIAGHGRELEALLEQLRRRRPRRLNNGQSPISAKKSTIAKAHTPSDRPSPDKENSGRHSRTRIEQDGHNRRAPEVRGYQRA
jgi:hypothetical protein